MDAPGKADVGKRLRRLREDRGYAPPELAALADVSIKTLYNLEHGTYAGVDPPPSFSKVCNALGVSSDDIIDAGASQSVPNQATTDAERVLQTLARMPQEVRVAMIVYGGWLMKLSPEDRAAEIDRTLLRSLESE